MIWLLAKYNVNTPDPTIYIGREQKISPWEYIVTRFSRSKRISHTNRTDFNHDRVRRSQSCKSIRNISSTRSRRDSTEAEEGKN
jgi:hypothetical protein